MQRGAAPLTAVRGYVDDGHMRSRAALLLPLLLAADGAAALRAQQSLHVRAPVARRIRAPPLASIDLEKQRGLLTDVPDGTAAAVGLAPVQPGQPTYPPTPTLRECLAFTIPALGIYAGPTIMSLIDAAFIGQSSTVELAALGPATTISDSVPFLLLFLSIAATNLVAKSHAAKDGLATSRIARTSLILGGIGGAVLGAATFMGAAPLSRLYCGPRVALASLCGQYVLIRALALPAVIVASIAQAICIAVKDTKTPMIAVALSAVLNLLGDFVLVSGLGMGINGAAWATIISQFCAAGLLLRVLARRSILGRSPSSGDTASAPAENTMTTGQTVLSLLSFIPFLFVMIIKVGMHNACAATAATLGGSAAAAHTALLAVAWLCFMCGDVGSSLAQAFLPAFATTRTTSIADAPNGSAAATAAAAAATAIGEGGGPADVSTELLAYVYPDGEDGGESPTNAVAAAPEVTSSSSFDLMAAWPTLVQLLRCTVSISAAVCAGATLFVGVFASLITPDPAVVRQMRKVLPIMIAALSVHGSAVSLEGLLLAQKAFRSLTITYVGVGISVAALLALVRSSGAGLAGVWGVYVWYSAVRVLAFAGFGGLISGWLRRRQAVSVTA